ncbi:MAG: hypothetical protein EBU90_21325 [Proteobacteria bacterium]|nr:hypothetical protein [Pseudomonadota bacterium]NBP15960.1 hypothetical protein [bacterium]
MFNCYYNNRIIKDTTDPIYYSLMKVDWRFFCTFTYNKRFFIKNDIKEQEMLKVVPKKFFNSLRSYFRLKNKELEYYCIHEKDDNLRTHIHCLISRNCAKHINYFDFINFTVSRWNSLNGGYNTQKDIQLVRQDKKQELVRYVSKRAFCPRQGIQDNDYFLSKGLFKSLIKMK